MDAFYSDKFEPVAHLRSLKRDRGRGKERRSTDLYWRGMPDGA